MRVLFLWCQKTLKKSTNKALKSYTCLIFVLYVKSFEITINDKCIFSLRGYSSNVTIPSESASQSLFWISNIIISWLDFSDNKMTNVYNVHNPIDCWINDNQQQVAQSWVSWMISVIFVYRVGWAERPMNPSSPRAIKNYSQSVYI